MERDNEVKNSSESKEKLETEDTPGMEEQEEPESKGESIEDFLTLKHLEYNLELWPTHHDITEQIIYNISDSKIKVKVSAKSVFENEEEDLFSKEIEKRFKVGLGKKENGDEIEVEIESKKNVKIYLHTFTCDAFRIEKFKGIMFLECQGFIKELPIFVKTFEPNLDCPKLLHINSIDHDAIPLLLKPRPRQEFKIPITNRSTIKANCEFKILPGGMNSSMHTFFVMPFRYVINPNETVRLILTVKYNIQCYTYEEFKKISEMRKLINVRIKDTKINMGFPVLIKVSQPVNPTRGINSEDVIKFIGGGSNSRLKD